MANERTDDASDNDEDGAPTNPFTIGKPAAPVVRPDDLASGDSSGNAVAGNSGSSGTGKRRGRKPGSTNKSKTKGENRLTASALEGIFFHAHLALAAITSTPELQLDRDEAKQLADAAAEVQSHYETRIIDPKTLAWINLGLTGAKLYGPRIVARGLRVKMEKQAKKDAAKSNVVQGNFNHAPT